MWSDYPTFLSGFNIKYIYYGTIYNSWFYRLRFKGKLD